MENVLIDPEKLAKAVKLDKFGMRKATKPLMKITKLDRINQTYHELEQYQGFEFVRALLENLNIKYEISAEDIKNIPKNGAFIAVSNHPFGMLDGIILLDLLGNVRKDVKVMANFLLSQIKNLDELFISVNPFENQKWASSIAGMKKTLQMLEKGQGVGIFPAGEVSSYQSEQKIITDREWQKPVLKLIQKAKVPIVPIYFEGANSLLFQVLGFIHPLLRTARLPSELYNKSESVIQIRIGSPILVKEQEKFEDAELLGRYLRNRTYALGSSLKINKFFKPTFKFPKKAKAIAEPIKQEILEKEILNLSKKNKLFSQQNFDLYLAESHQIPNILNEIGRLREITFREVGEGTNKKRDLDEHDLYYSHLFIWDSEAKCLVGAYRMGRGDEILRTYGKKGFYTHNLFHIKDGFLETLSQSVELGRSFILLEYQKKRLPLFMLWQGILQFLLKNPQYRYLIGAVSISNDYSKISRNLIVSFIRKHYFNHDLAQFITPRKDFEFKNSNIDESILLDYSDKDLKNLDKLVADIEYKHIGVPVLVKKYISLNSEVIGFNLDPKFNDALDGLMLLDIQKIPLDIIENLKRETV